MSIHFSREQVQAVLENHELWWEGKLDRALVRVAIEGSYAPSHTAKAPR